MRRVIGIKMVVILCLLAAACSGKKGASRIVTLASLEGSLQSRASAGSPYSQAQAGQVLAQGAALKSGPDGKARLQVQPGNTFIYMAENTQFTLVDPGNPQEAGAARLSLEIGKLWIVLGSGSLEVQTPAGTASVQGSEMSVGYDGSTVTVTCLEGHCGVSAGEASKNLTRGQACDVSASGADIQVRSLTAAETVDWAENVPEAEEIVSATETYMPEAASFTPTLELTATPTDLPTFTDTPTASETPLPTSTDTLPPTSSLIIDSTWGHISRTPTIAALYMLIHNNGTVEAHLTGASSPSCGSTGMQIMGIGPDGNDLPLYVVVPAGAVVSLQFQGTRVLCYNVAGGIGPGSTIQLTLHFEGLGDITVPVPIQNPPSS
jgi:copper(I)-binding protein